MHKQQKLDRRIEYAAVCPVNYLSLYATAYIFIPTNLQNTETIKSTLFFTSFVSKVRKSDCHFSSNWNYEFRRSFTIPASHVFDGATKFCQRMRKCY